MRRTTMPASARKIDANGFMLVKACPLSSVGIFEYSAGQLGLDGDPNRIVKVFRPESAVNDPAFLASLRDLPLINDHEMLSGFQNDQTTTAPEEYGVEGVLTSNIYFASPWALGDLKIFSRAMQGNLAAGKKDLSLGYSCKFEEKPGVWQGRPYEVVQTTMRGNHLALVGEGRVPGARVLDGLCFDHLSFDFKSSDKDNEMAKKVGATAPKTRVVSDSALEEMTQLVANLAEVAGRVVAEAGGADPVADPVAADPVADPVTEPAADPVITDPDDPTPEAEPAADPVETPEATAEPEADPVAAPAAEVGAGGGIEALIAEVEGILAKLKAAMGGTVDEDMPAEDIVEGLQESSTEEGAQVSVDADPTETPATAEAASDAALKRFYADSSLKDALYQRLSKVVGAFDCRAMDSRQVAKYGVKKLGIKCQDGHEITAVDLYLTGRASGEKGKAAIVKQAQDSATNASAELDAYLKGE